jgi:hypothetical protein
MGIAYRYQLSYQTLETNYLRKPCLQHFVSLFPQSERAVGIDWGRWGEPVDYWIAPYDDLEEFSKLYPNTLFTLIACPVDFDFEDVNSGVYRAVAMDGKVQMDDGLVRIVFYKAAFPSEWLKLR